MLKQETIQIQELDKQEEDGNVDAVYILTGALGDQVCISGALNQYYLKFKKQIYIITDKPSLFANQDYCKEAIDINFLSADGEDEQSLIFQKFKKIYPLYWQTEKHLKGLNTIVENYCDLLNVEKTKYPFFKIHEKDLVYNDKPFILVSLKRPEDDAPFIKRKSKYFTNKTNDFLIKILQDSFQNYQIIDIGKINISNFYEILSIVAKCKTFISVDTSLQHLAANEFCQKKGIVLWNNKTNIKLYGYEHNINLFSDFVHPYDNYDIILKNLKEIIQKD